MKITTAKDLTERRFISNGRTNFEIETPSVAGCSAIIVTIRLRENTGTQTTRQVESAVPYVRRYSGSIETFARL
jgi:hypothetical protein